MKEKHNSFFCVFIYGVLLGLIAFAVSFNYKVLDPQKIGWILMDGGDPTQHFLGWTAFRNSPWTFPLTLTDLLSYPHDSSIVFTDSIPLFALIFKLFRGFLPEQFQYFGIFGLCSFMLQGGFAALLLRRFTNRLLPCLLGTLFFLFVPAMFFRMFYHTSLAAQWTILAGFAIWLYTKPDTALCRILSKWLLLGCVTIAIHPFLAAMVSGIFFGQMLYLSLQCNGVSLKTGNLAKNCRSQVYARPCANLVNSVLARCLQNRASKLRICQFCNSSQFLEIPKSLKPWFGLLSYFVVVTLFFYLIGGFCGVAEGAGKFGSFGANLNALYNPVQPDNLIKTQFIHAGQYEGQAFIGAGMIGMVLLAGYLRICRNCSGFRRLLPQGLALPFFLICAIFFCYALSIKVTWNQYVLYTIPLPESLLWFCNVFRASGRFMWVPMYALMLFAVAMVIRHTPPKRCGWILLCLLLVQLYGLLPMIRNSFEKFKNPVAAPIADSKLSQLVHASPEQVRLLALVQGSEYDMIGFGYFALKNKIALSDFYFSRPEKRTANLRHKLRIMIDENRPLADHTLYLFRMRKLVGRSGLYCYEIDNGMIAGSTVPIPGFTPLPAAKDAKSIFIPAERLTPVRSRTKLTLKWGQTTFSPFVNFQEGSYKIIIRGENLKQLRLRFGEIPLELNIDDSGVASGEFEVQSPAMRQHFGFVAYDDNCSIHMVEIHEKSLSGT
ncbi:MAG: DUF6311 domain-containing protein [Victivallales bacterium]|nr:DUF6311 domain-containing protein [Victivallales bacterium]